jgi:hypothetical protein
LIDHLGKFFKNWHKLLKKRVLTGGAESFTLYPFNKIEGGSISGKGDTQSGSPD